MRNPRGFRAQSLSIFHLSFFNYHLSSDKGALAKNSDTFLDGVDRAGRKRLYSVHSPGRPAHLHLTNLSQFPRSRIKPEVVRRKIAPSPCELIVDHPSADQILHLYADAIAIAFHSLKSQRHRIHRIPAVIAQNLRALVAAAHDNIEISVIVEVADCGPAADAGIRKG